MLTHIDDLDFNEVRAIMGIRDTSDDMSGDSVANIRKLLEYIPVVTASTCADMPSDEGEKKTCVVLVQLLREQIG